MSVVIVASGSGSPERKRLDEVLPSGVSRESLGLDAYARGFRMENYESAPGTFPAAEFTTHMIGVGGGTQRGCSLFWRDGRITKTRALHPGTMFTASAGPLDGLRWDGQLQMLTLSMDPDSMQAALPEPYSRPPVVLQPIRAGDRDRCPLR